MPRGVPKKGFRLTRKRVGMDRAGSVALAPMAAIRREEKPQTIPEIEQKLKDRFDALEVMTRATGSGVNRSFIVSGPAGLGKSYTVESVMDELEKKGQSITYIKGYVRPLALYRLLYGARHTKSVLVFDDADSVFYDDVSINLLKGACDSTDRRVLHWLSESVGRLEDEDGEPVPEKFEFNGSVIFITNYDFDALIQGGSKLAPHFEALVSRSMYLDLEMKTKMDYVVRIRQVVGLGMLAQRGLSKSEETMIVEFIENNKDALRELSLRMVIKLATLFRMDHKNWQKLARQTCFRTAR